MLREIIGYISIFFGAIWLLKPEWLRGRMGRKANRRITWSFYLFLIYLSMNYLGLLFRFESGLIRSVGVLGLFVVNANLLRTKSKASTKLIELFKTCPLILFRCVAALGLLSGLWMIYA
ncbi:MAG: hypothetical protein ACI9CF_001191 [Candidatus Omnitrophota bacterium]|jgi:hypothetical protein